MDTHVEDTGPVAPTPREPGRSVRSGSSPGVLGVCGAVVCVAVAAGVFCYAAAVVYGLSREYGAGSWAETAVTAAVVGIVAGVFVLAAVRLMRWQVSGAVVLAGCAMAMMVAVLAGLVLGGLAHRAEQRRAAAYCTDQRRAALTAIRIQQDNRLERPSGQGDGSCSVVYHVPGGPGVVDPAIVASLTAQGWVQQAGQGELVFTRGGLRLEAVFVAVTTDPDRVSVQFSVW